MAFAGGLIAGLIADDIKEDDFLVFRSKEKAGVVMGLFAKTACEVTLTFAAASYADATPSIPMKVAMGAVTFYSFCRFWYTSSRVADALHLRVNNG